MSQTTDHESVEEPAETARAATASPTRSSLRRRMFRLVERVFAVIGLFGVLGYFMFDFSRITSESMAPTLRGTDWETGDRVLSDKLTYLFRSPCRWEVVAIRRDDGVPIIKRVVGLRGESIQMLRGGRIVIDGREIQRPDHLKKLNYFPFGKLVADQEFRCEEGYFVLGDDSRDSADSRFEGTFGHHQLTARPRLVFWPLDRIGWIR